MDWLRRKGTKEAHSPEQVTHGGEVHPYHSSPKESHTSTCQPEMSFRDSDLEIKANVQQQSSYLRCVSMARTVSYRKGPSRNHKAAMGFSKIREKPRSWQSSLP